MRTESSIRAFTVLLPAVLFVSFASGCKQADPVETRPFTAQEQRGQRLYNTACLSCHRVDSEGPLNGPGLKNVYKKKFFPSGAPANDERMTEVIRKGRRQMPAFPEFTDAEIADMIAYMRRL